MTLILLALFLLFCSIFHGKNKAIDNMTYVIVFLVLVIAKTGIDLNALPDVIHYFWGFKELSAVDWLNVAGHDLVLLKCPETGFRYILKLGSFLGNFKWSLFIVATIHAYAFIYTSKKYSPYIIFSLIIFVLSSIQSFFVLRQWLAISVTLFSYQYIISRNWKMFTILLLLAFSMHQTAIVFIPVYFIYGIKKVKRMYIMLFVIAIVATISFSVVFNFFAASMVGYEGYIDNEEANTTTLLISACYLFFYIFFLKRDIYKDGINKLMFVILILNFIAMLTGYSFSGINRLMMYYSVVIFLSVPITMKYIKDPFVRYAYVTIILLLNTYMNFFGSNSIYLNSI